MERVTEMTSKNRETMLRLCEMIENASEMMPKIQETTADSCRTTEDANKTAARMNRMALRRPRWLGWAIFRMRVAVRCDRLAVSSFGVVWVAEGF